MDRGRVGGANERRGPPMGALKAGRRTDRDLVPSVMFRRKVFNPLGDPSRLWLWVVRAVAWPANAPSSL